ncbi:hypothetical protein Emed_004356 [Eimeria media]
MHASLPELRVFCLQWGPSSLWALGPPTRAAAAGAPLSQTHRLEAPGNFTCPAATAAAIAAATAAATAAAAAATAAATAAAGAAARAAAAAGCFTLAVRDLFLQSPTAARYTLKYRRSDNLMCIKVTDNTTCLKFRITTPAQARQAERLSAAFLSWTCKQNLTEGGASSLTLEGASSASASFLSPAKPQLVPPPSAAAAATAAGAAVAADAGLSDQVALVPQAGATAGSPSSSRGRRVGGKATAAQLTGRAVSHQQLSQQQQQQPVLLLLLLLQ